MRFAAPLLALMMLCVTALAATTTALGSLTTLVDSRLASVNPRTARGRHERNVLRRIDRTLREPTTSLAGDLLLARAASRLIDRGLHGDAGLIALADAAIDDLASLAQAERDRLGAWAGRMPDEHDEPRLAAALVAIDRRLGRAAMSTRSAARAGQLARACRRMDATRDVLGIWGDPPPTGIPMPDFSLADVNPASPTFEQQVSPRDYLGKISAWYFGKAG